MVFHSVAVSAVVQAVSVDTIRGVPVEVTQALIGAVAVAVAA